MAHQLVEFDQTCDQICTQSPNSSSPDSDKDPGIALIEAFSDGESCYRPVSKELIETYIENDFNDILAAKTTGVPRESTIKLILSLRHDPLKDGRLLPLGIDSSTLKRLAKWIRMPLIFPHVLATGTSTFMEAEPSVPEIALQRLRQAADENLSFVLQSVSGGEWSSCFGTSFTYSFTSRFMYIFVQTYDTGSPQSFLEAIDIRRFGRKGQSPFLIPSAMVKCHLETRVSDIDEKREDIFQLECGMGVRRDSIVKVNPLMLDYDDLTRQINSLNAKLAWTLHSCKRIRRLLNFMESITSRYVEQAGAMGVSSDETLEVERQLRGSHAYLRSWNQKLEDLVEYLVKRLQALSQSVYSGIAQRDSANNIRMTQVSVDLAKTSHQIAKSTQRDSAVMRTIAAVTIVFLPGTFTATFFSTTFFDFGAGDDGRVYSKWLWLYFVLTLGLHVVVAVHTRISQSKVKTKMELEHLADERGVIEKLLEPVKQQ